MASLGEVRSQYPQYNDMSDAALADALHAKFYSDMPREEFNAKLGLTADSSSPLAATMPLPKQSSPPQVTNTNNTNYSGLRGVREAFVGRSISDPGVNPIAGALGDTASLVNNSVRSFARGVPVLGGLADEADAATNATLAPVIPSSVATSIPGKNWSERYENSLKQQRDMDHSFDAEHPIISTGAQIAGGVASGAGLAKAAPGVASAVLGTGAKTLGGQIAKGAASGAALAGASGFTAGEGGFEKRLGGAETSAVWGGLFGGAGPITLRALDGVMGNASRSVATEPELHDAASRLYQLADNSGLKLRLSTFDGLVSDLEQIARNEGVNKHTAQLLPGSYGAVNTLLSKSEELGAAGIKDISIQDVDWMRRVVNLALNTNNEADLRIGGKLKSAFDKYIDGLTPSDVSSGDPKVATEILPAARALWNKMSKSEVISKIIHDTSLRAEATLGGDSNIDRALRGKFATLASNESTMRLFTPLEREAIEAVVKGSHTANTLRYLGNLSPRSLLGSMLAGPLMYGTSALAGPAVGAGVGAGAALLGEATRRAGSAVTKQAAARVGELIRDGGKSPITYAIPQATKDTFQRMVNATASGMITQ